MKTGHKALLGEAFNSPCTADIIRVVLQYYVDRVIDPTEKTLVEIAVHQVMEEKE